MSFLFSMKLTEASSEKRKKILKKDLKIILDKIQQDSIDIKNISKDVLKTISSKFIGKSSDIIIDSLFNVLVGDDVG